ncbi:MAG: ABC transporter ATP-binding protein/permease [Bacteroidales bacterium]|nr:ABC transporter ATP-binding protein/permease [Bacteroidales bacterium]
MKNLLQILRYVIPYWFFALLNIFFNLLSILFSLVSFAFFIPVLDILFNKTNMVDQKPEPLSSNSLFSMDKDLIKDNFYYFISDLIRENGELKALVYISIAIVILFFLKNLFRYLGMFFIAIVRNGVVKDLRNDIYHKVLILPLSYYSEQRKGDIMARMTTDVQEVEWSIMTSLEMIFREPITLLVYIITLFFISPQLTLFVLILLPVSAFIIGRIGKSLKRTSVKGQKKLGEILSIIEETLSGLRIIKAFNAIGNADNKFQKTNEEYNRLMVRIYRKRDLASPLSEFLGAIVLVAVVWFGGKLVLSPDKGMDGSVFIVYLAIFSQLIPPAKSISQSIYNIQKGSASVERIKNVLDAEEVIEERPDARSVNSFEGEIEYRDVSFAYQKEKVLKTVNVKIPKGKTIAIVGPSGGGKSTMVDLLPRFYDVSEGELLLDGINIKDYIISDIRELMGIVTQESILFNDTVHNNIAFGREDQSRENVIEAAKIANAHDFIDQMEDGYDSIIGDRGTKLSGGQKQRISIARAVLRNPPILIFDEATSSLDTESERLVQDALSKLLKNRTSIIIAHRLSTIRFADEILVVQKGEIVERGPHEMLYSKNGMYRKLCEMQSFVN